MTIRYKCDTCGSVLSIKDEKAGTQGKCPKCKTVFLVPAAEPAPAESASAEKVRETSEKKAASAKREKAATGKAAAAKQAAKAAAATPPAPAPSAAAADDEFDPVAFLMEDDGAPAGRGGRDKPAPGPDSDDEIPSSAPSRAARKRASRGDDGDEFVSPYSGSASATADAMLGGASASAGAKELLTRTVEESRARAGRLDDEEGPREPSQISLLLQEFVRLSPYILGGVLAVVGLYYMVNSMVTTRFALPDLGYVTGTVTLDGKPLSGARVFFAPVEKDFRTETGKLIRVRTARGLTDESGRYELIYVDDTEGTGVGENRVWIEMMDGGFDLIPGDYGPRSRQIREVKPGSQEINFEMTSSGQPRRPPADADAQTPPPEED